MNTLDTGVTLNFVSQQTTHREPFILQTGKDRGKTPLMVRPVVVHAWTRDPSEYEAQLSEALVMESPGRQRVRLYCSQAQAPVVRMLVHGGASKALGRRHEPLLETLTWVQANTRQLRFFYDQPTMRIVDHTRFFLNNGQETQLPDYDQQTGTFHHPHAVTGALVVEYFPGFTLYEIEYDTGAAQISPEWFREIQQAWLAGNIHNATIPEVRVIAMGTNEVDQITFARDFWPAQTMVRTGYTTTSKPEIIPTPDGYRIKSLPSDPCWSRCKEQIQPDGPLLSAAQMVALQNCVDAEKSPKYHYVEESRSVKTERIYAPDSPDVYIDVARPVELVMKLKRADGGICTNQAPPGCCPELRLRFGSDG
ncbi:MAG: hypothetical protein H7839_12625 [Magnetococcus sp. YQC-5]